MEPSAAVPWSVLIAIGASLISGMATVILALLGSRLGKLEKQVEEGAKELQTLRLETTTLGGQLAWLKASDAQRRDDYLPRELALQRLEQQDKTLARIEEALERKMSVRAMPAVQGHRDPREEPPSEPPPLPPMRARLPSSRGR